jgi:hypothetical protein
LEELVDSIPPLPAACTLERGLRFRPGRYCDCWGLMPNYTTAKKCGLLFLYSHLWFVYPGLLEIPAYGLAMLILLKAGRRIPYACSLLMAGIFLLSITLVPRGKRPESIQWFIEDHYPPFMSASCLSFSVFLCVPSRVYAEIYRDYPWPPSL